MQKQNSIFDKFRVGNVLLNSYFLFPISYFLLSISYFLFPIFYFLLPISYFLLLVVFVLKTSVFLLPASESTLHPIFLRAFYQIQPPIY